jgi:hypothetical protein
VSYLSEEEVVLCVDVLVEAFLAQMIVALATPAHTNTNLELLGEQWTHNT